MSMGLVVRLVELGYSTTTGSSVTNLDPFKNLSVSGLEWIQRGAHLYHQLEFICTVAGAGPVCSSLYTKPHYFTLINK